MSTDYTPLLQPLQIGALTIKNRFCVGPLTLPSLHGPFGEFSPMGWPILRNGPRGALA